MKFIERTIHQVSRIFSANLHNGPFVSIITPSYNHANFIEEALNCVAMQDYYKVEHLVIDGGSTDRTLSILEQWEGGIQYVSEEDSGQSDAINKGFKMAKGDIIAWLNSDDRYINTKVISNVAAFFLRYPEVDIAYGRGDFIDQNGEVLREAYVHRDANNLIHEFAWSVGILQPSVFFRKKVLDHVGYLDEENHSCMDYEYWVRMAHSGLRFGFMDKKLSQALYHSDMKSVLLRGKQIEDIMNVVQQYYGFVHPRWLNVYAKFKLTDNVQIINSHGPNDDDPELKEEIDQLGRELFIKFNSSPDAIKAMLNPDYCDPQLARRVLDRIIPEWENISATS